MGLILLMFDKKAEKTREEVASDATSSSGGVDWRYCTLKYINV